MVGIVQPDGDEIAHLADARPDARIAANERQLLRLELAQLVEALGRQRVAGNVGNDFGKVADAAFGIQHAGLFAPRCTITDELHGSLLKLIPSRYGKGRGRVRYFRSGFL